MSNIIDKIRLSGTDYTLSATTSGISVVEVTQAEYDALPSSAKTDASKMYVITDAEAGDLSQYWTSAQTNSAITQAVSGKQDTLVSGTNIKTINNESILGSGNIDIQGGGKAIEAGRGISITTGETADTVSFNLPISADTDGSINKLLVGDGNTIGSDTYKNIVIGDNNTTFGGDGNRIYSGATIIGYNNEVGNNGLQNSNNDWSVAIGRRNKINGGNTYIIGVDNSFKDSFVQKKNYTYVFGRANSGNSLTSDSQNIFVFGAYNKVTKSNEFALGEYNVSSNDGTTSGNTFFSIGNGTADNARHNAFEIRQNGDIYLTKDGQDVKLQDQLGGGGGGGVNVVQTTGTSTTDVMSQDAATSNFIYDINLNYKLNGRDTLALQGKGKNLFIPYMTINGKKVLSINDLSVVETSAITSSVTSSSTDDEIPTAKAVYDAIPTVPTSASQLTNDIGYITSGDAQTQIDNSISGKVDTTTFNTYSGNVETSLSGKQDTLSAGTGIDITDNVISATGGGSTYTAGRGIDITSNAISISLPISAGTGSLSIAENNETIATGMWSHAEGVGTSATSYASHAEGKYCSADGDGSHAEGHQTQTNNFAEHASGRYNVTSYASNTFGDSGNTLFSVGNGTDAFARHNAFEIRQNGDIYLSNGTNDVKLQDYIQIKAVKISQSDYDQLQTKDPNTLYIITTT